MKHISALPSAKGAFQKILTVCLAACLALGCSPLERSFDAKAYADDTPAGGTITPTQTAPAGLRLDANGEPLHEEGIINLGGDFVVAGDGQITADLKWSFPYKNPLLLDNEKISPDPSLPYRYKIWQARKNSDGTWGNWEMRSPVDVDKRDGQVRVLNVAPNTASKAYLKDWMDLEATDYDGTKTTVGKGIIRVYPVEISEYRNDPETILKTDPETKELTTEYQYDVIMFGTYDANASQDLNEAAQTATNAFWAAGGGIMLGHDTLTSRSTVGVRTYFNLLADKDHLNITTKDDSMYTSTKVAVVDTGFLTSRPWNLEGRTLDIPTTHMLGQRAGGDWSPGDNKPRIWMQLADNNGNVQGTRITPGANTATDNYYLITNGNIAMIQTGHSNGQATLDEAKVFANTLIYLAQATTTTTARDATFIDEASPTKPSGALSGVDVASSGTAYTAKIALSGSADKGTDYAYRIQAIPQATIDDASMKEKYTELWSSTATDPMADNILRQTALSGLKGYYVAAVDSNANAMTLAASAMDKTKILSASSTSDEVTFTTDSLNVDTQYYVHAFAVDYAGNISEDLVIPVKLTTNKLNFHANDGRSGSDVLETTLLTDAGLPASWQPVPAREGYRFDGWYPNANGTGTEAHPTTAFTQLDADGNAEVYAKWVKVWNVNLSQRGMGSVRIGAEGTSSPFDEGTDVPVSWQPAPGYHVSEVWLDDTMLTDLSSAALNIDDISEDHSVTVIFEKDGEEPPSTQNAFTVETTLRNAPDGATITQTTAVGKGSDDAKDYKVEWTVPAGYKVVSVTIDGIEHPEFIDSDSVTFTNVERDHDVQVTYAPVSEAENQVTVTTELTGGPGFISPSKTLSKGESYSLSAGVADDESIRRNYEVDSVSILKADGTDVTASYAPTIEEYTAGATLAGITEDLKVIVRLKPKAQAGTVAISADELLHIDTSHEGSGSISESRIIRKGDTYDVTWQAAPGWQLFSIMIDGRTILYPEPGQEAVSIPVESTTDSNTDTSGANASQQAPETINDDNNPLASSAMTTTMNLLGSLLSNGLTADEREAGEKTMRILEDITSLVSGTAAEDASNIASPGHYLFGGVSENHTIHAVFVKTPAQPSADISPDDPMFNPPADATSFDIITQVIGGVPASITGSMYGVSKGSDRAIEWTVPEGYIITGVRINGVDHPELLEAGKYNLSNIDNNYVIQLLVERPGAFDPSLTKTAENTTSKDGNTVGDTVAYTITASNAKNAGTWEDAKVVDVIPAGLDVDASSIKLRDPAGNETAVPAESYDAQTRILQVNVGTLKGGESAQVTFLATINQKALMPGSSDIANIVSTADDGGDDVVSEPAVPNDGKQPAPKDSAKIEVVKAAANESRQGNEVRVGDTLVYTITLKNTEPDTVFSAGRITDELPQGIEIDPTSITLSKPGGVTVPVSPDAYDAAKRLLAVFVGDVFGNEEYTVKFKASATADALEQDIGNIAKVYGSETPVEGGKPGHWGSPEDYDPEAGDPGFETVVGDGGKETEASTQRTYPSEDGSPSSQQVMVKRADPNDPGTNGNGSDPNADPSQNNGGSNGAGGSAAGTMNGSSDTQSGAKGFLDRTLVATGDETAAAMTILGIAALAALGFMLYRRRKEDE